MLFLNRRFGHGGSKLTAAMPDTRRWTRLGRIVMRSLRVVRPWFLPRAEPRRGSRL